MLTGCLDLGHPLRSTEILTRGSKTVFEPTVADSMQLSQNCCFKLVRQYRYQGVEINACSSDILPPACL